MDISQESAGLYFDESGENECGDEGAEHEVEGEVEEGVFIREHVQKRGKHVVKLVVGPQSGLLAPGDERAVVELLLLRLDLLGTTHLNVVARPFQRQ